MSARFRVKRSNVDNLPGWSVGKWRKGWDSNPRYGSPHASFQDWIHKPLGHPSFAGAYGEKMAFNQDQKCSNLYKIVFAHCGSLIHVAFVSVLFSLLR